MTYVLALLHFNLQYCAGGLDGLFVGDFPSDNDSLEDQMITQSFAPVLDLLDAHPTWGIDIELQARMIEVLAERHPDVLAHLKTLADSGQVELVSAHYSDQLWTAYSWRDEQHSLELVQKVFDENELPLSGVVFTQEGQLGPGLLARMPDYGYDVAVMAHNLGGYQWGHEPDATLYDAGHGVTVVPTSGLQSADGTYSAIWSYLDDGELLATNGLNCYLGPAFVFSQPAVDDYASQLESLESLGAVITTVGAYVDAVKDHGTTPLPPLVDGSWQPDDTLNLFRWMGGSGLWGTTEDDDGVLVSGHQASNRVAAAEVIAGADAVDAAWRDLLLGEVSDATGWNPYETETQYALDHFASASDEALAAVAPLCGDHGSVRVDLATSEVSWDPPDRESHLEPADAPDVGFVAGDRVTGETWSSDPDEPDAVRLDVAWGPGEGAPSVALAWDPTRLATTAALVDDQILEVDPSTFRGDPFGMPLPAGLVELTDGTWLVEDLDQIHLAGLFSRSAGTVELRDDTAHQEQSGTWTLWLVTGDEDRALAFADALNVNPQVDLPCPDHPDAGGGGGPRDRGCGCDQGGPLGAGGLLLALAALRRRRSA